LEVAQLAEEREKDDLSFMVISPFSVSERAKNTALSK
jgi:hypothetical protein